MKSLIQKIEAKYQKSQVVDVKAGDTVAVHQKIKEGAKERVQIFEGIVIKVTRSGQSLTNSITVRRIASGVGVEKSFLLHSPNVLKVEVSKRSKVRRNYLSYLRARTGKSSRLNARDFDRLAVNTIRDEKAEAEEEKLREEALAQHEAEAEVAAKAEVAAEKAHEAEFKAHEAIAQETAAQEPTK